jgi:flagellar biosynthesis/type III secretory pathway protein FliH
MALIKKELIEDSGTLLIERQPGVARLKLSIGPLKSVTGPTSVAAPVAPRVENISEAQVAAQRIVDEALGEAENVREEAKQAGYEEGRAETGERVAEALETLNQAVKERKKIIKEAEPEILRLAIRVAEQIIKSEVSLHRDVCLNIVAEAIARVSDREQIIVRVNREDAEYLKRYKDRLTGMLDGVKSFSVLEDPHVEAGGCVIETNLGFIDAKISTKLKSIEAALKKVSTENESSVDTPEEAEEPAELVEEQ